MSLIYYQLNNYTTCAAFVAAQGQQGLWNPVAVPNYMGGPGIYVIHNGNSNNRYIGISANIQQRFGTRLETLHTLGFTQADLNNIYVFWGRVGWWNTNQLGQNLPAGAFGGPNTVQLLQQGQDNLLVPNLNVAGVANNPGGYNPQQQGQQCTGNVDNQVINFENLLIRFFVQGLGIGGTITNTQNIAPVQNNTNNDMRLVVSYCRAQRGGNAQNVALNPTVLASFDKTLHCAANNQQVGQQW